MEQGKQGPPAPNVKYSISPCGPPANPPPGVAAKNSAPAWPFRLKWAIADKLVYSKFAPAPAAIFRTILSGGASTLQGPSANFFWANWDPSIRGYGSDGNLSPFSLATTRIIAVAVSGRPIPTSSSASPDDGEILAKAPASCRATFKSPEIYGAKFFPTMGWFQNRRTSGYLDKTTISSSPTAKKILLKTAAGKIRAPQPIENV